MVSCTGDGSGIGRCAAGSTWSASGRPARHRATGARPAPRPPRPRPGSASPASGSAGDVARVRCGRGRPAAGGCCDDRPTPNRNRLTVIRLSWADQVPDGDSKDTSPTDSGSGSSARSSASRPVSMVGMIMRARTPSGPAPPLTAGDAGRACPAAAGESSSGPPNLVQPSRRVPRRRAARRRGHAGGRVPAFEPTIGARSLHRAIALCVAERVIIWISTAMPGSRFHRLSIREANRTQPSPRTCRRRAWSIPH